MGDMAKAVHDADGERENDIDFCSLGMFIIDDIYPSPTAPDQTPHKDITGGAGTFAAIGARLFSPPPQSRSVGWIVDAGTDFPPELHSLIDSWDTGVLVRERDAPTTRGWNGYSGNQHRSFHYLTDKKRLTCSDLTPCLLRAKSFHLICSPARCVDQVRGILARRAASDPLAPRPIIVWEPVPDRATASQLQNTYAALKYVDVVSPNHEELARLFSFAHPACAPVAKTAVEDHARRLLEAGTSPDGCGAVVVRCGAEGCFVLSPGNGGVGEWLPAFHSDPAKVVDPTGGGNGFLGGLAVGLVRNDGDLGEAARWASVAASFCIEQTGMPSLERSGREGGREKWNGHDVFERLEEFRRRSNG